MRRLKLYLDTSVISHIDAPHKPSEENATQAFFRFVRNHADEYELFISPIVDAEIRNCPEPKQSKLLRFIDRINCTILPVNVEALELADQYIQQGVLTVRHHRDLTHIAYAVVAESDYIVSWNFTHFVNIRTVNRVNAVNRFIQYRDIQIVTPIYITGDVSNADL